MKLMPVKRDIEVWWSEWKFYIPPLANFIISISSYLVGWSLCTATNAMPLARSGAFATAVSIGFTLWNYRQILLASEDRGARAYDHAVKLMNIKFQSPEALSEQFRARIKKKTEKIDRNITYFQAFVLIFATLVWGFGDLATGPVTAEGGQSPGCASSQ